MDNFFLDKRFVYQRIPVGGEIPAGPESIESQTKDRLAGLKAQV